MYCQREVLWTDENHGVLVSGGVRACKNRVIVRRHLSLFFNGNTEGFMHPLKYK